MYAKFFGLSQDPFSIAPDPRYLFMSERHREALAHLLYGLNGGGGFVLLSGEIGTGKTTVCRCFLEQIPNNCRVAYIFNPKLSVSELLRSICDEFHVILPASAASAKDFIDPLNEFLLDGHAAGQNSVLIIDEAQNLSADVLEQLRLLTNLETNERKLLQIVLIGQPELRTMLARPELEQLAQRVIARFHLDALSAVETSQYVAHRLAVAGMSGSLPFDHKALARIYQLSRGVPRRINLLCDRAMLGAYANGAAQIDRRTVDQAAHEVFGPNWRGVQTRWFGLARPDPNDSQRGGRWPVAHIAVASLTGLLVGAALVALMTGTLQLPAKNGAGQVAAGKSAAQPATRIPAVTSPAATASGSLAGSSMTDGTVRPVIANVMLSRTEFNNTIASSLATQNQAWQALGKVWGLVLDERDTCEAAQRQKVLCFRSQQTSLSLIRELNRPGIITLFDGNKRPAYALLTGLSAQTATLRMGLQTHNVSLATLTELWRGDFATLWRAPEGYAENTANGKLRPVTNWLPVQLAKVPGAVAAGGVAEANVKPLSEATLRAKVYAFQLAHGLAPDGQAGPMTSMQLNRATGVDEPRLTSDKP